MRYIVVVAIAAIGSLLVLATLARAEIEHSWCAQYGGRNCGFVSYEQCMRTMASRAMASGSVKVVQTEVPHARVTFCSYVIAHSTRRTIVTY